METEHILYVSNYDNEQLSAYSTTCKNAKALVVIFHGMSEHQKRYQTMVDDLSRSGFNVLTIDHRGHGESLYQKKITGYFADKDGWYVNLEDLHQIVEKVNEKEQLPIVLFGHSMGTLFARTYLKKYPQNIAGVYMSASPDSNPTAKMAQLVAKIITLFNGDKYYSKLLNDQIFAAFNKSIKNPLTEYDWLSYNEENVHNYIMDPLCGFQFTTKALEDLTVGVLDVYKNEKWNVLNPNIPIHFISGIDDVGHRPKGLEFAVNRLKSQGYSKVDFEYVEHARHEIFHEAMANQLQANFIAWIKDKVAQ